ncbi:hypothetical protein [Streptomyces sp. NPDC018045]|uniref:hypothetical protein n=1 Tax=Streptomyces sp. NPDC018045 TaxID=3365037 RepID=UPI00379556DE
MPGAYARHTATGEAVGLRCAAVVWSAWATPTAVDATSLQMTGSEEQSAATKVIRQVFGDRYAIANVQRQTGTQDVPDQLLISMDRGSAQVSWPDTSQPDVTFESSAVTTENSFPAPGVTERPRNGRDAKTIADGYVQQHCPAQLRGADVRVTPTGEKTERGRVVGWHRRSPAGVLMPMRMDVQINVAGRVSRMLINTTPDPASLPPSEIDKETAGRTALAHIERSKGAAHVRPAETELPAARRDGHWRTQWVVGFVADDPRMRFEPVHVDAVSGDVDERATQVREIQQPSAEV